MGKRRVARKSRKNQDRKGLYVTVAGVPKGEVLQIKDREPSKDCDDAPRVWRF